MSDPATLAAKITGIVFVATSMAAAGLVIRPSDIAARFARPRPLILALAANFILAPLVAWGLTWLLPVDPGHAIGLLLLGCAAGAPFLPKVAGIARADTTLAVTVMAVLVFGTVLFMPLAIPVLVPGAAVSGWKVARPLLAVIVAPLLLGIFCRWRWEKPGLRVEPALARLSDLCLIAFLVLVFATHLDELRSAVGSGAILAASLFVLITGGLAYLLAGPDASTRRVLILGTAQRNVAAALVIAGNSFADQPNAVVMVLVTDVVAIATLFIAAARFRALGPASPAAADAPGSAAAREPAGG